MQRYFEANHVVITVNLNPLEKTTELPYLGCRSPYNNIDWAALYRNLRKYQRRWGITAKAMGKTGQPIKAREMMYKAVV